PLERHSLGCTANEKKYLERQKKQRTIVSLVHHEAEILLALGLRRFGLVLPTEVAVNGQRAEGTRTMGVLVSRRNGLLNTGRTGTGGRGKGRRGSRANHGGLRSGR